MRPLHEQFLTEIAAEKRRLSRRGLFTGTAKVAGAGALAMVATGSMSMRNLVAAQGFSSDVEVLNFALTLEHLEFAFYRDGIGLFTFGPDGFNQSIDDNLAAIRDHEGAHVAALTDTIAQLGGEPVAEGQYNFQDAYAGEIGDFLATAAALENTGVAAYDGAAQFISDPNLLTTAGGIVSVEARHAAYLNLITNEVPFPAAFEEPLTTDQVLEIAGPFIVS